MRTPQYGVFDDVQQDPWESVRGMDKSRGYNGNSDTEHYLSPDEMAAAAPRHQT